MLRDLDVDLPILGKRTLKWPVDDHHLYKWLRLVDQVDEVVSWTAGRGTCVQAGGACGVWPLALAEYFETVYTFEPYPPNYAALVENCADTFNIVCANAALADKPGSVSMTWHPGHEANLGAQFIKQGGEIPAVTLDAMDLDGLDLLYLDVEGAEFLAIKGAEQTILKYRPTVVYEDRRHCERFGFTKEQITEWFKKHGYRKVSTLSRDDDAVMVPE